MSTRSLLAFVLALALVATPAALRASSIPEGAESPQAVVKRIADAGRAKDGSAYAASILPADRPMLSFAMAMGVSFTIDPDAPNGKAREAEFDAILKKYGVDERLGPSAPAPPMKDGQPDYEKVLQGVDHVGFLGELVRFAGGAKEPPDFAWIEDSVFDMSVQGSTARARGTRSFYEFEKVDGRWYLHLKQPDGGLM